MTPAAGAPPLVPIAFRLRATPLAPAAVVGRGRAAIALAARLAGLLGRSARDVDRYLSGAHVDGLSIGSTGFSTATGGGSATAGAGRAAGTIQSSSGPCCSIAASSALSSAPGSRPSSSANVRRNLR